MVVGCSVGTGWVVVVGLTGGAEVVDRRRVELVAGSERFAYHEAANRDLAAAEGFIEEVRTRAAAAAAEGLVWVAGAHGAVIVGPAGAAEESRSVADILRSHAAIHRAEGILYRSVVRDAFLALGVEVSTVPRSGLLERVAAAINLDPSAVQAKVDALGRTLGPPWRKEQKEAALAAWWRLSTL